MKEPKSEAANQDGESALASAHGYAAPVGDSWQVVRQTEIALIDLVQNIAKACALRPTPEVSESEKYLIMVHQRDLEAARANHRDVLKRHNDKSSATAATRRVDWNRSVMPPFAAAHG
jgi:hypothetical protein